MFSEQDLETSLFWSAEARDQLMARLAFYGCKKIVVHFSGSGDSGQIDQIDYIGVDDEQSKVLGADKIDWQVDSKSYDENSRKWVMKTSIEQLALPVIIDRLMYSASDRANIDWWNNEGGQGSFTIDLQDLKDGHPMIRFIVSENFTKTNDYEYDFSDGRERIAPVITLNK